MTTNVQCLVAVVALWLGYLCLGCSNTVPTATQSPQEYKKSLQGIENLQPHANRKGSEK